MEKKCVREREGEREFGRVPETKLFQEKVGRDDQMKMMKVADGGGPLGGYAKLTVGRYLCYSSLTRHCPS